ncbi:MAG TPA: TlpA disulfide reductase family protein [Chitinophaga sp.]|uniref:TlpA family protein disulfide reductase n=1 Tax=Chitinophaga sp. TaxID=1869181 RepID=UPI002CEB20DA|nr:TlpA disulfide reductase family protein [Chitinophaga sp.]HVI44598.1 TlpA disulfide reductase family protein [Chitinophaga sp.]
MLRLLYCTIFFWCLFRLSYTYGAGRPIKPVVCIGCKVADLSFRVHSNGNEKQLKISQLRGKLVILDFGATWCGPFIGQMCRLASLQKKFGACVQIILVTRDSQVVVSRWLEKYNHVEDRFSLPMVTDDSALSAAFPHQFLPHYVWISPQGYLMGATGSDMVNSVQIEAILAGKKVRLNPKVDPAPEQMLLPAAIEATTGNGKGDFDEAVLFRSKLRGYQHGAGTGTIRRSDSTGHWKGMYCVNQSIFSLYQEAYGYGEFEALLQVPGNRVLLELPQASGFRYTGNPKDTLTLNAWMGKNSYCYDLDIADPGELSLHATMARELDHLFGLQSCMQERMMRCRVLKWTNDAYKLYSKVGPAYCEDNPDWLQLSNSESSELYERLLKYWWQQDTMPFIDETGGTRHIDLELHARLSDPAAVALALAGSGLEIVTELRRINMLVIRRDESVKSIVP